MTVSTGPAGSPPPSVVQDLFGLARYYLGGRRRLLLFAGLAIAAGLALNWGWLTALGVAPILVSLLPCAAMCALGLCMNRAGGKSCSTGTSPRDDAPNDITTVSGAPPDMAVHRVPAGATVVPGADAEPQPPKERSKIDA